MFSIPSTQERLRFFWDKFQPATARAYQSFRHRTDFHDVLLAVDVADNVTSGTTSPVGPDSITLIPAHRIILSSFSPFFDQIFAQKYMASQQKPLVYLRGITFKSMTYILDFIYQGEVHLASSDLDSFMHDAKVLKIIGIDNSLVGASHTVRDLTLSGLNTATVATVASIGTPNATAQFDVTQLASNVHHQNQLSQAVAAAAAAASGNTTNAQIGTTATLLHTGALDATGAVVEMGNLTASTPATVVGQSALKRRIKCEPDTPTSVNDASNSVDHVNLTPTPTATKTNDPSLYCSICLRYYKNRNSFRTHMYQLHPARKANGEDEMPDTCQMCNKAYKNSNSLRTHIYQKHNNAKANAANLYRQAEQHSILGELADSATAEVIVNASNNAAGAQASQTTGVTADGSLTGQSASSVAAAQSVSLVRVTASAAPSAVDTTSLVASNSAGVVSSAIATTPLNVVSVEYGSNIFMNT